MIDSFWVSQARYNDMQKALTAAQQSLLTVTQERNVLHHNYSQLKASTAC